MRPDSRSPSQQRSELATALSACRERLHRHRADERHEQHPHAHRRDLHAGNLRPRAAEPQRADAGRARHPRRRAVHGAGADRPDPRPHPGAHRRRARRGAQRPRLRDDRAAAAEDRRPHRRHAAAARSRQRALVSVRARPDRAVRPAVAAGLYRRLLCLPSADRNCRAHRRDHPRSCSPI